MHWRFLNFDFEHAQLAWSDLNNQGPDDWAPTESIRYVNVAKVLSPDGSVAYLDLDVTVTSGVYDPPDETRNGLSGKFARHQLRPGLYDQSAGQCVLLRRHCRFVRLVRGPFDLPDKRNQGGVLRQGLRLLWGGE